MQKTWNKCFFYDGTTLSDLIDKAAKAVRVMECPNSKISIGEHSDIKNGICKYTFEVYNYDILGASLFIDSEITFMELFDYLKDNKIAVNTMPLKEFIFDLTNEALELYITHKRQSGIFYEVETL